MEDWDLAPATSAITSTRRSSSRIVDTIEEAEMIVVTGADADAAELMVEAEGRAVRDGDAATEDRGDGTKASLWDTRSATKEKTTATSGGSMRGPDDLADEEDDKNDSDR
jgi:chromosome condensin MukBEF MukE localization factor